MCDFNQKVTTGTQGPQMPVESQTLTDLTDLTDDGDDSVPSGTEDKFSVVFTASKPAC
jgi:hypothetical protein